MTTTYMKHSRNNKARRGGLHDSYDSSFDEEEQDRPRKLARESSVESNDEDDFLPQRVCLPPRVSRQKRSDMPPFLFDIPLS